MKDTVNSDGNLLGRIVALILIVGATLGVHHLACGRACFMKSSCCPPIATTTVADPGPAASQ